MWIGRVLYIFMNKHTEYMVMNDEWVLNNSAYTLCSYMGNYLDIRIRDSSKDLIRYSGILDYYVRNEYGYEYMSSNRVNGIVAGRYIMDPWNREFLVFPYERGINMGRHGYEGYFSDGVYKRIYGNEVKGEVSDIKHNVMLLTTTVHGRMVYCLDIMAGVYGNR